jgi:hypothetical protein
MPPPMIARSKSAMLAPAARHFSGAVRVAAWRALAPALKRLGMSRPAKRCDDYRRGSEEERIAWIFGIATWW